MDCWGHRRMTPRTQRRLPPGCCCRGWRCHGDWSPECRRCRLVPFHRLWSAGCRSWEERRRRTTEHGGRYKKLFYRKAQIYLVNLLWIIILPSNPPDREIRTNAQRRRREAATSSSPVFWRGCYPRLGRALRWCWINKIRPIGWEQNYEVQVISVCVSNWRGKSRPN